MSINHEKLSRIITIAATRSPQRTVDVLRALRAGKVEHGLRELRDLLAGSVDYHDEEIPIALLAERAADFDER